MAAPDSTEALSVIGFFLTLVSLLGSFFYIHLSDWLREVVALEAKWDVNKIGTDRDDAQIECRYEAEKAASWATPLTSLVVSVFVVFIFILGLLLWLAQPEKDVAWIYVGWAGVGFFIIYIVMTISLLWYGYLKARLVLEEAKETFKEQPRYREHSWQFWRPKRRETAEKRREQ